MSRAVAITSASQFLALLNSNTFLSEPNLILVDFWAPWCAPCRALLPVLERVAHELNSAHYDAPSAAKTNRLMPNVEAMAVQLLTVNADEFPELCAQYQVKSLPTVLLIQQGAVRERLMGMASSSDVKALLTPYLNGGMSVSERSANAGLELKMLEEQAFNLPLNADVQLAYVQQLLAPETSESFLMAQAYLSRLDFDVQRDPRISQIQSCLRWLLKPQIEQGCLSPAYMLASRGDFTQALDWLFSYVERQPSLSAVADPDVHIGTAPLSADVSDTKEDMAHVRGVIVALIDALSDRQLANVYRRKLFLMLGNH